MRRGTKVFLGVGTIVVILAVVQGLASLGFANLKYLPTPTEVLSAGAQLITTGEFWGAVGHTAWVSLLGWVIGCVIGAVAGVAIGLSRHAQNWTLTSLEAFRAIPVVAILPVMALLLGLTTKMELWLVVYAAVWPVLLNSIAGIGSVKKEFNDLGATLRMSKRRSLMKIVLPSAMSQISVGVDLALSISFIIAVVAEIIANPAGVGHEIAVAQSALQPAEMFAYIAVSGLMGLLFVYGLHLLYRAVKPGILAVER